MKCPKCGFVSFDHLDACKKCGTDVKKDRNLLNLPAVEAKVPAFLAQVAAGDEGAMADVTVGGGMELGGGDLIVEDEPILPAGPSMLDEDLDAPDMDIADTEALELGEEMSLEPEADFLEEEIFEPAPLEEPVPEADLLEEDILEPEPLAEPEPELMPEEEPVSLDLDEEEAIEPLEEDLFIDDSAIEDLGDLEVDLGDEALDLAAEAPDVEPPEIPALDEEPLITEEKPAAAETDLSIDDDALESLEIDLGDLKVEE